MKVAARFALDFRRFLRRCKHFALALDHDDGFQPRPLMAVLQPLHIVEDRTGPGLDAAVVAVDSLMLGDLGVLEAVCLLLGREHLDILPEGALVPLEREDVIGLLVDDFLGDGALAADGVDGALDRPAYREAPGW